MLAFGIISILVTAFAIVRLILLQLIQKTLFHGFIAKVAPGVAAVLWLVGLVVYGGIVISIQVKTAEVDLGAGLGLAIAIVILTVGVKLHLD
jgi:hypothetical protein